MTYNQVIYTKDKVIKINLNCSNDAGRKVDGKKYMSAVATKEELNEYFTKNYPQLGVKL